MGMGILLTTKLRFGLVLFKIAATGIVQMTNIICKWEVRINSWLFLVALLRIIIASRAWFTCSVWVIYVFGGFIVRRPSCTLIYRRSPDGAWLKFSFYSVRIQASGDTILVNWHVNNCPRNFCYTFPLFILGLIICGCLQEWHGGSVIRKPRRMTVFIAIFFFRTLLVQCFFLLRVVALTWDPFLCCKWKIHYYEYHITRFAKL